MTKNEQRLAMVLGTVLVVGGAFVAINRMKRWKVEVDAHAQAIAVRRMEAESLLAQREFWQQRSEWLQEKQPEFTGRSDADLELLKLIQESASKHKLTTQVQPMPPEERPGLTSSTMLVGAKGDMTAVMEWLYELQQPSSFISIPALTLTPNEEDTSVVDVAINIRKWYRLPVGG